MASELIERMARAAAEAAGVVSWEAMTEKSRQNFRVCQRAALEAAREPTERMIEAAEGYFLDPRRVVTTAWQEMIDAELQGD